MYQLIKNLEAEEAGLQSLELKALAKVWSERQTELEGGEEFQNFLKKLQREWAIETGIIERLYIWDRGVTEMLIEQGIDASLIASRGGVGREQADQIRDLIIDQHSIIEGLYSLDLLRCLKSMS